MKRHLLLTCAALVLAACSDTVTDTTLAPETVAEMSLPDGVVQVERVTADERDALTIPYTKYVLDNGLTVVLHEDDSDPLVHVDVTYHVGSGREDVGKSGFAHFFEHMMFQGSENVADEEHFRLITESGGTLNGTTNSDRTNYFQTVPSNQLERMLWLEADRMGYFLDAVTQEKFEVQRETVKNERGQRVDNRPYGQLFERVGEAMFPEGHPYSWSTIGYIEDLNRATLDDLKKFFLRWYGPNNAVLTIGGDIDSEQTLEWVTKYFGPIPAGPAVDDPEYVPVTLDADRYISMEDEVSLPLLYMSWPTVRANHPDEAPLDVLVNILGQGKTSLLYKNLEKTGKAVNVQASHGCRELNCSFTLLALPNPASGTTLTDLDTVFRESLKEFEDRGVLDDDLERVKASIVSGLIYGLESVSGKVGQLAYYETFRGTPDGIDEDVARYEGVTKADVLRVYETYIQDKPAVVMSIVPRGQGNAIAAPDTMERPVRDIPDTPPASEVDWSPPEDDFDRSVVPSPGPNPQTKAPDVFRTELSNGIPVLVARNTETPTTTVRINMDVGLKNDPLDKLGLASGTANYLSESRTTESSVEDLANRLDKFGSSISFGAGDDTLSVTVRSLTENIDETMQIVVEKLTQPDFNEEDFTRLKAQIIEGIKQAKKQPTSLASDAFYKLLYGADNSVSYPNAGTLETVENLTLDDFRRFYEQNIVAGVTRVVAVSDLSETEMEAALQPLTALKAGDVPEIADKPYPELEGGTLYFIDKPDAAQSEIRIGRRDRAYDPDGQYFRSTLVNYPLGGAFNSRINLNLREDKGYTYGARSGFRGSKQRGAYIASAGVRADTTADSIREFIKEIEGYREDGITDEELSFTKAAIGQRDAREYETPRQKLGFLSEMQLYNLDTDFVDTQSEILAGLTKAEVNALAAELDPAEMIIVVVGDRATVLPELETLGYPIVELDDDGNPV